MTNPSPRVLFRVAAGPRVGFGHLVRGRSLARALGVQASVSIRGSSATERAAASAGWDVHHVEGEAALAASGAHTLVVDDPCPRHAARWIGWAKHLEILTATVHDLGLGYVASDLGIDGSIEPRSQMRGRYGDLAGPAYAILDPAVPAMWAEHRARIPGQVLIALGGGAHVYAYAARLCRAIVARSPEAQIRVAAGFAGGRTRPALDHGQWVAAPDGLAGELAAASVAVVAGGVTLYEACALGTPAIAVALTSAQHVTVRAFAARGAVVDGHRLVAGTQTINAVAGEVDLLLRAPLVCDRLALAGRHLVDGRGAFRVADRLVALQRAIREGTSDAA
jgi:spore coat polysaccharide biosynthesis predicted glycosyltransferase SpsG